MKKLLRHFNDLTLGKKIWSLMTLLISFSLSLFIYNMIEMRNIASLTDKMYQGPVKTAQNVLHIELAMDKVQLLHSVLFEKKRGKKKSIARIDKKNQQIQKSLHLLKEQFNDNSEYLKAIENFDYWLTSSKKIHKMVLQGKHLEAKSLYYYESRMIAAAVGIHLDALSKFTIEQALSFKNQAHLNEKSSLFYSILFYTIGLTLVFIIGYAMIKLIINQINFLVSQLTNIKSSLTGLSYQSNELSNNLSSVTTHQSESTSDVISAISQISAMVSNNIESSVASEQITTDAVSSIDNGKDALQKVERRMHSIYENNDDISNQVEKSSAELSRIFNMIKEISAKTQMINDIVFQTKLLSFNASVEAARAGEHGKGFSVVAEEIGNLANVSGKSATEIAQLLDETVKNVNEIVESNKISMSTILEASTSAIEEGKNDVSACTEVFKEVSEHIKRVSKTSSEISAASKEQGEGVKSITQSMNNISNINQQNLLTASQNIKSSEELEKQSVNLTHIGMKFLKIVKGTQVEQRNFPLIEWKSEYEVKIDKTDNEHKELIEYINQFIIAVNNKNHDQAISTFNDLFNYTSFHFSEEEEFLRSIDYPEYNAHKGIHNSLIDKLKKTQNEITNEKDFDYEKTIGFLISWLVSHILGVDIKYAEYYQNKESKMSA